MKNSPTVKLYFVVLLSVLALTACGWLLALDAQKEQRIAEQTIDSLFDGEPVWLPSNNAVAQETQFLALLTEGDPAKAAIILVHGTGQGPDTPFVIAPLRELFAELNYTTLSLQMPVLGDDIAAEDYASEFDRASDRLSAGVTYIRNSGATRVYMVAHSLGSSMMMNWAANGGATTVDALVALGFGGVMVFDAQATVKKLKLPLLDVIGERDFDSIITNAPARSKYVSATNVYSAQTVIIGADHFYNGKEKELVDTIDHWLKSL